MTLYFAVLAAIKLLVLEPGKRVNFDENWIFGLVVAVPLGSTFSFFMAVFSFGLAGDLAARRSIYPTRMFTLPMTNAALAGWPMLYGAVAMAVLNNRLIGVLSNYSAESILAALIVAEPPD